MLVRALPTAWRNLTFSWRNARAQRCASRDNMGEALVPRFGQSQPAALWLAMPRASATGACIPDSWQSRLMPSPARIALPVAGPPCHARCKPPSALRVCVHPMFMPCLHARVSHACVSAKNANGRQRHLYNERACCSSGGRSASRSPCAGCTGSRVNADRQHACTCEQVSALLRWSRVDSDMLRSVGSGMLSMARGTWSLLSMDAKLHLRNSTCDH